MTDTRFPERLLTDRRLLLLDVEHRWSWVVAMIWSVSNRTDGRILPEELGLVPGFTAGSVPALVGAGLWKPARKGWLMVDFATTQTSAHELEVLENVRRNNREAKARERARKLANKPKGQSASQQDVSMTRQADDTGQDRTGRTGQAFENGSTTRTVVRAPRPSGASSSSDCSWCKGADLGYACPECGQRAVS